ncbi:MAG: zinc transporter ZupT [Candidatus Izimaplasma sp.]|nr:zinc transporter ZupT [Candidatus Izimaplasma bacterium]
MPDTQTIILAFLITLGAGLATGIGSLLAFYRKKTDAKFLSTALGFSAGVMIYVSFVEIFPKAKDALGDDSRAFALATIAFFSGIALIAIIDKFVPSEENPHEIRDVTDLNNEANKKSLMRMGLFSALAIGIHNFPEGLATFMATLESSTLGISIGIAIAIHNIPEGIAVSVPIYYATGDKKKALKYSFLSGFSEPIGAIVGYLLLITIFGQSSMIMGFVFAGVAGIMVYISLDELLPTAEKYGEHHLAIYGLIAGMATMAVSLLLFN